MYNEILNSLPELIFEINTKYEIVFINDRGLQLSGYSLKEIQGLSFHKLIDEKFHSEIDESFSRILNEKVSTVNEWELVKKDKTVTIPIRISASFIEEKGRVTGIRGVILNISHIKALENKLKKSEERIRWLSDIAHEGLAVFFEGKFLDANSACFNIFGCNEEEFFQKDIFDFALKEYHEIINDYIASDENESPCEIKIKRSDEEVIDIELISKSFIKQGKQHYTFLFHDISHRKKYEYVQEHDELTNLLNFRGFCMKLNDELITAKDKNTKLAIITIRVEKDEFNVIKNINPDLERVLLKTVPMDICDRLKNLFFKEDTIARTGDNEYMTLHNLPHENSVDNTVKLINKILEEFSTKFVKDIKLIARIGVTFYPDDFDVINPNRIISNSRYACDEAIFQKRDYMFYDEKSHLETIERIEFIKDLIIAVNEEKCKNFLLHYQPKVDREENIVGLEALVRWKNSKWATSDNGLVPPNSFIHVAEEIGLISEIGKWVLFEACITTKKWQDSIPEYKDLEIAVNVSASQLNDELIEYVDYVLSETGLEPQFLELEITERESIKEKNANILETIRKKNISIAIDDFGIDYSSLSKLPKLSIDTIKLDKSYIDNVANDDDYENLVNYTIKMVHGFKYKVVAEGVEKKEQAEKLFNEMDCDRIQGFYFYRPMPEEEIEKKLKQGKNKIKKII